MGSQIAAKFSGSNAFQEIFAFKPPEVSLKPSVRDPTRSLVPVTLLGAIWTCQA